MLLKIQTGIDNQILRRKSVPVTNFGKKLVKFLKDMAETMLAKDGIGLAAPQVGVNERIIILNFQLGKKEWRILPLVNPEIISSSKATETTEEGCLSLPNIFGKVARSKLITIRFQDERGSKQILTMEDLNARATQHEIDHLDGVLFIDRAEKGSVKETKTDKI